jgi:hypothetical protein
MILREVEARIDPEQIKNGSPEPPLEDLEDEELDEDDLDDEATAEDDDELAPDPDAADEDRN